MKPPAFVNRLTTLSKRIMQWRPVRAFMHFGESSGAILAGGMTYQAIFAIFAAIWVGFSIAGLWLTSNPALLDQLYALINQSVPGLIGKGGVIDPTELASTGTLTWTGAIALVGLIGTTLGWLSTTAQAVRSIFGMPRDGTFFLLVKLRELGLGAGFGLALIVSALISLASTEALGGILGFLGVSRDSLGFIVGARTIGLLVVLVIDTLTLAVLFRVLSRVHIPFRKLVSGSLLGGVALGGLKVLGGALLGGAGKNPLLATFAVVIGLLIWFNFMNTVILLTASWISVGMQDAGIPPQPVNPDEAAAAAEARELEARRIAALAELRDARAAHEASSWGRRWASARRLRAAEKRAAPFAPPT
ncbi:MULTISPECIES: YihY/virulence factor BrkB family protein [Cryobacterium]|uniref:YihY/virulence factor BrkB family protein n=1 Tax=Cryobacterium glucosi TaxID=1259175 RepID=A0ABY2ILB7_9MICO|nr:MULTISPECIES: YihY/virulence factor BrkB family protein [Cryobacterium]TFB91631.1 YihY/virulence factor BrkB family protein [Cryobacterium sp. MDB2-A-1]TFC09787.1 YihY/virulence factor BrkB family protein [Cryobacterium sp. MDB2-A-2]TFC18236.1 YihY/virulence factor BrkB family protein [Cryobacterium sp. MDB2-10]TFC19868.1 YihY/virulence factor BrkB family protein [Cryobacterium glucosi]